jgi:hypothetical protein
MLALLAFVLALTLSFANGRSQEGLGDGAAPPPWTRRALRSRLDIDRPRSRPASFTLIACMIVDFMISE